jgi:hypothetical protein
VAWDRCSAVPAPGERSDKGVVLSTASAAAHCTTACRTQRGFASRNFCARVTLILVRPWRWRSWRSGTRSWCRHGAAGPDLVEFTQTEDTAREAIFQLRDRCPRFGELIHIDGSPDGRLKGGTYVAR